MSIFDNIFDLDGNGEADEFERYLEYRAAIEGNVGKSIDDMDGDESDEADSDIGFSAFGNE